MPPSVIPRLTQLKHNLCWISPYLAPAIAALKIIETDRLPDKTAAVDSHGRMFIDPQWSTKQSDEEIRFTILHECLHLLLGHHHRRGSRHSEIWNIAADLVINDAINALNLRTSAPAGVLNRAVHTPDIAPNLTVEEVYELLMASHVKIIAGPGPGSGCGVIDADADAGDGVSPSQWRDLKHTVETLVRGASDGTRALVPLLTVPPSRVRWAALVRQLASTAVSQAGRDVTTWARRSRRSPSNVNLPGARTNVVKLAIVIDASGSMSDDEVSVCVAEAYAAVMAAGVEAFLVVHDHVVQSTAWIKPGSGVGAIVKHIKGRGGTAFTPAYAAVAETRAKFAAITHFTDGYPCELWPNRPRNCARGIIALTPEGRQAVMPGGWRVVPIEVPGRV
jgi:predicted metal-dependent peptidase